MKIIILLLLPSTLFAQVSLLQGEIRDKATHAPIAFASVVLMKGEAACNSDDKGVFRLVLVKVDLNDTLWVNSYGYKDVKIPVSSFSTNWKILLDTNKLKKLPENKSKGANKAVLNGFDNKLAQYYTGFERPLERFKYLQLAQKLTAPANNNILKSVNIKVLIAAYEQKYDSTKFLIHVYDMDKETDGPGKEITPGGILGETNGKSVIEVKLPSAINIPGENFFVAIEWLRIKFNRNEINREHFASLDQGLIMRETYKPIIGMSNKKGEFINTWAMNFKREWQLYTYFVPYLTDFAISAEVEY
ncbi:hypothetical protein [Mucilaginibacter gynuensis]